MLKKKSLIDVDNILLPAKRIMDKIFYDAHPTVPFQLDPSPDGKCLPFWGS